MVDSRWTGRGKAGMAVDTGRGMPPRVRGAGDDVEAFGSRLGESGARAIVRAAGEEVWTGASLARRAEAAGLSSLAAGFRSRGEAAGMLLSTTLATAGTGAPLVVAMVARRFASMSFDAFGNESMTASKLFDPPWSCSSLQCQLSFPSTESGHGNSRHHRQSGIPRSTVIHALRQRLVEPSIIPHLQDTPPLPICLLDQRQ